MKERERGISVRKKRGILPGVVAEEKNIIFSVDEYKLPA
jgi:hypothetical protein